MSTQPEHDDLDKTDELPQLDVAAYEASLAEDALSATDSWMVESLRESETVREFDVAKRSRDRASPPLVTSGVDLSVIDRLETRIGSLEAELTQAQAAKSAWEAEREAWNQQRAAFEQQIAGFAGERERLEEQQGLSRELVARLQRQLQELSHEHAAQLRLLMSEREEERAQRDQLHRTLTQQLEQSASELANLQQQQAQLHASLEQTASTAAERERALDDLQRTLVTERSKNDTLARNFAAKLADYDIMSSLVTQRNATVAGLESDRKNLAERLERAQADLESLQRQLEEVSQRASEADRIASELGLRDGQLSKVGSDLERLTRELQETGEARQRAEREREELAAQTALLEQQLQQAQRELAETREMRDSLNAERDTLLPLRDELSQRLRELETMEVELSDLRESRLSLQRQVAELLPLREQLEQRNREFESASSELELAHAHIKELHTQAAAQTNVAVTQRQELAIAQQALVDIHMHRDQVQRSLDEALRNIERLQAVSKDDEVLLNERNEQLAAARQELEAQTEAVRGLEHSLSARDQLIEDLRAEMRTLQEERGIVAEQLKKSRARVTSMTQEIFNRDNRIALLKADLAVHTEALAAIRRDVDRIESPAAIAENPQERVLEPLDHDSDPFVLNRRVMTIGRTNDNDIFIPSKMISRHHARLLVGPNAVIVEDTGSTNGCFVNDQQIKQHVLREGDVLSIGDLKFRLVVRNRDGTRLRDNVVDFDPSRHLDS